MKSVIITLTDDIIDRAFQSAQTVSKVTYSDTGAIFRGGADETDTAVETAITKIRELMKDTAHKGWAFVRERFDNVMQFIKEKAEDLGENAKAFRDRLMDRIKTIFGEMYDMLLSTLKNTIMIGGQSYQMESVEIEHSLKLTGELELSIETLCKFAAEGEISIMGSYTLVKSLS